MTYKEIARAEIKKAFIGKVSEILDKPLKDARIQLDYHYDEVPTNFLCHGLSTMIFSV